MSKQVGRKNAGSERLERAARPQRRSRPSSGEGAASALESWREIERTRSQCDPADEPAPSPTARPNAVPRGPRS